MLRYLIPHIAWRDLPPMLLIAACGALLAGMYGMLHDQATYALSPEYFTKLKAEQFRWADFGFPERFFVAEIGFLATWWVGFFSAWFLARRAIPSRPRRQALGQIMQGFAIIFLSALAAAVIGYGYGVWRGPDADYSSWATALDALEVHDRSSFIRVAYIHNAGYLGGVAGLALALTTIRRSRNACDA